MIGLEYRKLMDIGAVRTNRLSREYAEGRLSAAMAAALKPGTRNPTGRRPSLEQLKDLQTRTDTGFHVQGKPDSAAELLIYTDIGAYWDGVTASAVRRELKALGVVKNLTVRINSAGGDVFEGTTIYNLLRQHAARITVYIDGLAASIASLIAMAGDTIYMADNAMMMVHPAWSLTMGSADDMEQAAKLLRKIDENLVGAYVAKTGMDPAEIEQLMRVETWMTAAEAVDFGFADEVVRVEEPVAARALQPAARASTRVPRRAVNVAARTREMHWTCYFLQAGYGHAEAGRRGKLRMMQDDAYVTAVSYR